MIAGGEGVKDPGGYENDGSTGYELLPRTLVLQYVLGVLDLHPSHSSIL